MHPIFSQGDLELERAIDVAKRFSASDVKFLRDRVQGYLPSGSSFPIVATGHVDQVIADVRYLKNIGRASDGAVPLRAWLELAIYRMKQNGWSDEFVAVLKEAQKATLNKYPTKVQETSEFAPETRPAILVEPHPSAPSADNRGPGMPAAQTLVPSFPVKPSVAIPAGPAQFSPPVISAHDQWKPRPPPISPVKQDPKPERMPGTGRSGTRYAWIALLALAGAIIAGGMYAGAIIAGAMYEGNPDPPVQTASKGLSQFVDSVSRTVSRVVCGGGIVGSNEGCDDGNVTSGDGCSNKCIVEKGWHCSGAPSMCTCAEGYQKNGSKCESNAVEVVAGGKNISSGPYNISCPPNHVIVGFYGRKGWWVDRIGLLCAPINADETLGPPVKTDTAGGDGGADVEVKCPTNESLVGVDIRTDSDPPVVFAIDLRCQTLPAWKMKGASPHFVSGIGTHTHGGSLAKLKCDPGSTYRNVHGKAGEFHGNPGTFVLTAEFDCLDYP